VLLYGDPYISLRDENEKCNVCYDFKLLDNDVDVQDMFQVEEGWEGPMADAADCSSRVNCGEFHLCYYVCLPRILIFLINLQINNNNKKII